MTAVKETPQATLNDAIDSTSRAKAQVGNALTVAELSIKLAEAQGRIYSAQQAEIANLFIVINSPMFSAIQKHNAITRVATLLDLDDE